MNKRRRYKAKHRRWVLRTLVELEERGFTLYRAHVGPATYTYWISDPIHHTHRLTAEELDKAISEAFRRCL